MASMERGVGPALGPPPVENVDQSVPLHQQVRRLHRPVNQAGPVDIFQLLGGLGNVLGGKLKAERASLSTIVRRSRIVSMYPVRPRASRESGVAGLDQLLMPRKNQREGEAGDGEHSQDYDDPDCQRLLFLFSRPPLLQRGTGCFGTEVDVHRPVPGWPRTF